MKTLVKAKRPNEWSQWQAYLDGMSLTACNGSVDALFAGLSNKTRAEFEITNVRPTTDGQYHTFKWRPMSSAYKVIGVNGGYFCLTTNTSYAIKNYLTKCNEKYTLIYVSVY